MKAAIGRSISSVTAYRRAEFPRSRDDKRYTEKKNKTERARRKKEDIARLRGLVDLTLGLDPRIKRIKQEEKEAREAKKKAKNPVADNKAKLEEEKKKAEEEAKKQEELDQVRRSPCCCLATLLIHFNHRRSNAQKRRKPRQLLPMLLRRPDDSNEPRRIELQMHNPLHSLIHDLFSACLDVFVAIRMYLSPRASDFLH